MTRDEAVKKAAGYDEYNVRDVVSVEKFVDRLTRLGLLKLDEPKTVEHEVYKALGDGVWTRSAVLGALADAGLRVVRA